MPFPFVPTLTSLPVTTLTAKKSSKNVFGRQNILQFSSGSIIQRLKVFKILTEFMGTLRPALMCNAGSPSTEQRGFSVSIVFYPIKLYIKIYLCHLLSAYKTIPDKWWPQQDLQNWTWVTNQQISRKRNRGKQIWFWTCQTQSRTNCWKRSTVRSECLVSLGMRRREYWKKTSWKPWNDIRRYSWISALKKCMVWKSKFSEQESKMETSHMVLGNGALVKGENNYSLMSSCISAIL